MLLIHYTMQHVEDIPLLIAFGNFKLKRMPVFIRHPLTFLNREELPLQELFQGFFTDPISLAYLPGFQVSSFNGCNNVFFSYF